MKRARVSVTLDVELEVPECAEIADVQRVATDLDIDTVVNEYDRADGFRILSINSWERRVVYVRNA
jgi:hypothetical protein